MKKILKISGIVFIVIVVGYFILASLGPDICVITGAQLPKKYVKTIGNLGFLKDSEEIKLFYSDAFLDIRDGMYFVTDENLVIYSRKWNKEENIIPFSNIAAVRSDLEGSYWNDSILWITTKDGDEYKIPISNVDGGDKGFYDYIKKKIK